MKSYVFLKKLLMKKYKIHKDGVGFCVIFILLSSIIIQFNEVLGYLSFSGAIWCLYFFRIPNRKTPDGDGLIISCADGRVVSVKEVVPPGEFGLGSEPRTKISIFLNIFDVHINYIPIKGKIIKIFYQKGRFFNAAKDKASEHNEQNALVIELGDGGDVGVVQIAGLVARRIRCDVKVGDLVSTGQYYGLIRFGSRQEIYLPKNVKSSVQVGEKVFAAKTILASVLSEEAPL